jgi:small GTP-binding protein
LKNLTGLYFLNLRDNKIFNINCLEKLKKLKSLNLCSNQISDISYLYKLIELQYLNLRSNQISDINFLEKLTKLHYLNLSSNNIRDIPLFVGYSQIEITMEHYGVGLCLYDNPIESPPIEIIKQGRESILDWYEANKKRLNEIKIILIGEPKAGKTSILRRLKYDLFNEDEAQTDGVNIEHIQFGECKTFVKQTSLHKITGHFWDFGGQEIMNATHQFFLTHRCVYVLVLDARKDANVAAQIRQWAKRIKATGGNSSIIVVANQIDVNTSFGFENLYELQKELPQIKHFIKASCKTKESIDLIKDKLEELIPQAEFFNTPIDERWISIKEKLEEETKVNYFLDEARFLAICINYKLKEKREQKNAINFLNDLGIVLHFEEVKDYEYYVLDPYWITYGVYQILTSVYAGKNKGVVMMDELDFIINEEEDKKEMYHTDNYKKINYTNNQRRFLVDVLNQFKLCFYLPDRSRFIIPDLLDTNEPIEITEPIRNDVNKISFVYCYDYLPESTMPNIMVETNQINLKMWRTGCVLKNDDCNALISNYQNRISIIVSGEYKRKREFMSVVRYVIDSINQKQSDKPIMLIPLPRIDAFADYEELLEREKDGEEDYILYKPVKQKFKISKLLDGVATQTEVRELIDKIDLVLANQYVNKSDLEIIKESQQEIFNKLNDHFQYLIKISYNNEIKEELLSAIEEMNSQQTEEITKEIIKWIAAGFEVFEEDLDDKIKEIYTDLKKTDNIQMKLKLAVPLINLLGVNLETELDVKSWAKQMFEKYKLPIFKLMGFL